MTAHLIKPRSIWGQSNPKRGLAYHGHAVDFLASFPINQILTVSDFDGWLLRKGCIPNIPQRQTDEWSAHRERRRLWRDRLNKAASHERMVNAGYESYVIEAVRGTDTYEVRPNAEAVVRRDLPKRTSSFFDHGHKENCKLLQGVDWTRVAPYDRFVIEELMERERSESRQLELLNQEHTRLIARISEKLSALPKADEALKLSRRTMDGMRSAGVDNDQRA